MRVRRRRSHPRCEPPLPPYQGRGGCRSACRSARVGGAPPRGRGSCPLDLCSKETRKGSRRRTPTPRPRLRTHRTRTAEHDAADEHLRQILRCASDRGRERLHGGDGFRCVRVAPGQAAVANVLDNVLGVPSDAGKESGRHRVEEEEPDEVEPRLPRDDPAVMDRLDRLFHVAEDREVDPGEVRPESRAPDDVRRLEDAVVLEQRQSVTDADDARNAFDASGGDVLGFTRTSGAPWERSLGRILRPIGVRTVSTRWPMTRNISGRKTSRAGPLSMRKGT